jgi:urocanate hydratase
MTSPKQILQILTRGIPDEIDVTKKFDRDPSVPHAPVRRPKLTLQQQKLAVKNALRYFPEKHHKFLAVEFYEELKKYGHIYMYRFRPTEYEMKAYSIDDYPAKCKQAAAIMLMIQNNLDKRVAQYPHELITYGGNGSVFNNWAQYLLVMKYLSEMTDEQTLVMYSGHPLGLFPSHKNAPRVVITNGLVVPNYSSREDYELFYALGCTIYGQMTAGSYAYIGPQGIVHGTTLTVLNAGRKYLGLEDLRGKVFVSSGLGGMSGAQPKAGTICGCISVTAEVNKAALEKRYNQGWIMEKISDLEECIARIKKARQEKKPVSIGFLGNIVSLWERLAEEKELLVELGSDQTSLHNPYGGGYYPVQLTFDEANKMMVEDPEKFKSLVQESLRRQVAAINKLTAKGMKFWDYGNSFLLEASRAKADILNQDGTFKYPSYVEDIMGDIFSLGFGPFRWVCLSNDPKDLEESDKIAAEVISELAKKAPQKSQKQYNDNLLWITKAGENKLVVGSQARILYSDAVGRVKIAEAFNDAIKSGRIKGGIVLSRDHHDVSGADSPYRETSNIRDGSYKTADMAVQTVIGNSFRGATWVALHNGGGTGWGEAINCGFGLVLDGTEEAAKRAREMLFWDVTNGLGRRSWSGHPYAEESIKRAMEAEPKLKVTIPNHAKDSLLDEIVKQ